MSTVPLAIRTKPAPLIGGERLARGGIDRQGVAPRSIAGLPGKSGTTGTVTAQAEPGVGDPDLVAVGPVDEAS